MAIQIKIIDTEFNEHEYFVSDYSGIRISENNDGRFRDIDDLWEDEAINKITAGDIGTIIFEREYDLDDLGIDIDDYIDNDTIYDKISVAEHFNDVVVEGENDYELKRLIRAMEKAGYTVSKKVEE